MTPLDQDQEHHHHHHSQSNSSLSQPRRAQNRIQLDRMPTTGSSQFPNLNKPSMHSLRKETSALLLHSSNNIRAPIADNIRRPTLQRSLTADPSTFNHRQNYGSTATSQLGSLTVPFSPAKSSFNLDRDHESILDIPVPLRREYYDDFTSVDWVEDSLKESKRQHQLNKLKGSRGTFLRFLDKIQDWILIALIALTFSLVAYIIDRSESILVDLKRGYCRTNWLANESMCCMKDPTNLSGKLHSCSDWVLWPEVFRKWSPDVDFGLDYILYITTSLILAYLSVKITLTTKTTESFVSLFPEANENIDNKDKIKSRTIYSAYGSGVPEVKTILSGFIIRKFLSTYTLIAKSIALIFAIASGMSLGKEGPFVHLATCVGNILCRIFKKFSNSEFQRRQILSAAASAGVALAFGSPLGGVLFSLEEVSYYLPGNQLFKTFFCAVMSILFLRFLNPYGTGKTVLFEVQYQSDWVPVELILYVIIGIAGGIFGAFFIKFVMWWPKFFRSKKLIKNSPTLEVLLISLVTALTTYTTPFTNTAVPELLLKLASPCFTSADYTGDTGLCPINFENIPDELFKLSIALIIKTILTAVSFGIKVPGGIYVPAMVIGALFGRIFAMWIQYIQFNYPGFLFFDHYNDGTSPCIDFGIYAMISAGAFMAGITRMNITLATIMFELTSSYTYVLPISISIAVSNWVAYAIQPLSLYESLIVKNEFPFLPNKKVHDFTNSANLKDLMHSVGESIHIDLSHSHVVKSSELKESLIELQLKGMVDGCIPIVKNRGNLIGILPAPELELALDRLIKFCSECSIDPDVPVKLLKDKNDEISSLSSSFDSLGNDQDNIDEEGLLEYFTDFSRIVQNSPIIIDVDSPLSLVEYLFTKLGNRAICIFEDGEFVGFLHKKIFIDYCRDKMIL